MYVDGISVRVVVCRGDHLADAAPVDERRANVEAELLSDFSFDDVFDEVGQFAFDRLEHPTAFSVETRHVTVEQGGSSAWVEVVIRVMEDATTAAWEVVAALVAEFIADQIKRGRQD